MTWVSTDAIPDEEIAGALPFQMVIGAVIFGQYFRNPNYHYAIAEVSNRPMPVQDATVDVTAVMEDRHSVGFIPDANIPYGCKAQPDRLHASVSTSCLPLEHLSVGALRPRTVAKMIADSILTGSTSHQLWSVPGHDELLMTVS